MPTLRLFTLGGLGLRARIVLLVLLIVTPLTIVLGLQITTLHREQAANLFKDAQASAMMIADQPRMIIPAPHSYLATLARLVQARARDGCGGLSRLFSPLLEAHPYFTTLSLLDLNGQATCHYMPRDREVNVADRSYFRQIVRTGSYTISNLVTDRFTGKDSIIFSAPVLDDARHLHNVLILGLSADWLARTLQDAVTRAHLPTGAVAVVVDDAGTVVASAPATFASRGSKVRNWSAVHAALSAPTPIVRDEVWRDGVRRASAYVRLFDAPNGAIHVRVGVPIDPVMGTLARSTGARIGIVVAVMTLALALTWFASESLVLRPLRKVWRAANALRQGDFSARVGPVKVRGELGELASAFDNMADRLAEDREGLQRLAMHDPLTGLFNRAAMRQALAGALEEVAAGRMNGVAVILLDLDGFKEINDSLGHPVGDQVLVHIAEQLLATAQDWPHAMPARLGGDEFVIVVRHQDDAASVESLAVAIRDRIMHPLAVADHKFLLAASGGIVLAPEHGTDVDTLIQNADVAMYQAKRHKRAGFCVFAPELNADAPARLRMHHLLKEAVARKELVLHYQPKVDARSGKLSGCEALVRWNSPVLGPVSPAQFIPLAEQTGVIADIGDWVLRTACAQLRAWQGRIPEQFKIAVNLSPRQFNERDLSNDVARLLQEAAVPGNRLEIEITEGALMHDPAEAIEALHRLRALGVAVAVDDFGTGYSSLAYLKHLPIDRLKVDRAFVAGLPDDARDRAIIGAVVAIATEVGFHVTAEGVETPEQANSLRKLGCDEFQGYHFGRPVPAAEFEVVLAGQLVS